MPAERFFAHLFKTPCAVWRRGFLVGFGLFCGKGAFVLRQPAFRRRKTNRRPHSPKPQRRAAARASLTGRHKKARIVRGVLTRAVKKRRRLAGLWRSRAAAQTASRLQSAGRAGPLALCGAKCRRCQTARPGSRPTAAGAGRVGRQKKYRPCGRYFCVFLVRTGRSGMFSDQTDSIRRP